ncbi:acyltransferase family protein [Bifidobacterium sp. ESL0784]|uniref:acyltransferase family protein n=1 Tax=Bifidobacterium sp. ESL0784 TaxID=2983231 RepID=UPI0023F6FD9E|nr:acyltransferase family protein [Bifidobacterium sp. ESL0784]MDF7641689.1 acyltransferase family protein [Bifidobacterium sp. ESL0784]
MSSRVRYFDIAKGIAMIGVVLGHSILLVSPMGTVSNWLYIFFFSFHMPLFFLLSGYFMHPDRRFAWRKESRELLLTYVITAATVVLLHLVVALLTHRDVAGIVGGWTVAALYGSGSDMTNTLFPMSRYIGAIWFLLALFWAHLLVHVSYRLPATPLWILVFFACGYVSSRYVWLPLSVQAGLTATLFVYLGCLAKSFDIVGIFRRCPILWVPSALVWAWAMWKFTEFGLATNAYGQTPLLSIVGSIGATLCIVGASSVIDRWVPYLNKALALIGRYTLPIFCAHLLEEDDLPWGTIAEKLQSLVGYQAEPFVIFAARSILIAVMVLLLYRIPKINVVFFPSLAKKIPASNA